MLIFCLFTAAFSAQIAADTALSVTDIGGIKMASIPEGSCQMGAEGPFDNTAPVHEVDIDSFYMSVTEVTQGLYKSVMNENPSNNLGDLSLPVEKVSWYDAVRFCNRLSEQAGLAPCYDEDNWTCDFSKNGFRLPTEAEWEYACRAGSRTRYNTGDTIADLDEAGWFGNIEVGNCHNIPHPAGMRKPNAWGLYDMHGSQWEWCNDWYDAGYYQVSPAANPTGPESGICKVMRGGSWISNPEFCRSDTREMYKPELNYYDIGIRLVCRPTD